MEIRQFPFYFKSTIILFGIILLVYAMASLRGILVPFSFALIIAILLNPLANYFQRKGIGKIFAIIFSMLIAFLVFGGIMYFISSQIIGFSEKLPILKNKLFELLVHFQAWVQTTFGISLARQVQLVNEAFSSSNGLVGQTLGSALTTLLLVFILPVYVFLLLYYKTLILNFIYESFAEKNSGQVADILRQTKSAIQSYMVGLLIEALIVATLNSTALLILGVEYAILLGLLGALLNMLPYIGGIIAIALPVLMATVTKEGYSTQLGIIIAYVAIQFVDNNFLVPKIVSSKVQINALVSILIVLLGGALWGIAGMFLSIPFIAIVKIICDRVEGLRPFGKLLGDEVPTKYGGLLSGRRNTKASLSEEIVKNTK
ncbi:AI-2E family transporter [Flavisolibacter tropicus]|uniref:Permease n=1 Tax=Flavisolibacter tropicus TaxID=1492898 RepID=A0A172TVL0_9BACT|nr:AI-2E family transporter [Flavisolibacter tropicus]ANE50924.1 permease [Flavisolibacter tropicus]